MKRQPASSNAHAAATHGVSTIEKKIGIRRSQNYCQRFMVGAGASAPQGVLIIW